MGSNADEPNILFQEMANPKQKKFKITDQGEFVDGLYKEIQSSEFYGKLIGRKTVASSMKNTFTVADIMREGYLWKRGSWVKSWKRRYFMIRHDIHSLCYFASKESLVLLGSIPLEHGVNVWKMNPKEADGFDNVYAIQPIDPDSKGSKKAPKLGSSAVLLRGDATDDLWKPSLSVMTEGAMTSWIDDICHESEAVGAVDHSASVESGAYGDVSAGSAYILNDLLSVGGPSSWWDVLFNDCAQIEPISQKHASKQVLNEQLPPSQGLTKTDSAAGKLLTDADLASIGKIVPVPAHPAVPSVAGLRVDSDDEDSSDDEGKSPLASTDQAEGTVPAVRRVPRRSNITEGQTKIDIKAKKVKKAKPEKVEHHGPPPFVDPLADAFQHNGRLTGVQLSVHLQHMVSCKDKIFLLVFAGRKMRSETGGWALKWTEASRTEIATVTDHAEYGGSYVENFFYQFSLAQLPWTAPLFADCSVLMIALYKLESGGSGGGDDVIASSSRSKGTVGPPDLSNHIALCRCILHSQSVTAHKLFTTNMEILIDIPIDISAALLAPPNARLGVSTMISKELEGKRRMLSSCAGSIKPYAEVPFSFPSATGGTVFASEQLLVSQYGSVVAAALLSFYHQERAPLLVTELDSLKVQLQKSSEMLVPMAADPHLAAAAEYEAHQHDLMQKVYRTMKDFSEEFVETFTEPFMHVYRNMLPYGKRQFNAVLPPENGGNRLRRSAWKKHAVMQYACTNLHFQTFNIQRSQLMDILRTNRSNNYNLLGDSYTTAKADDSDDGDSSGRISSLLSITLGCPTAHGLKFHDGGLLRILTGHNLAQGAGPSSGGGVVMGSSNSGNTAANRLEWMRLLSNWTAMDDLCTHIRLQRRENCTQVTSILCPGGADPTGSREARVMLWQKRAHLAERIDICSSQALGCAVSVVKSIVAFATQVGGQYRDILVRSLSVGFLVGFQSFLSTQGDELGMLEDLDCAALWLNLVTVRLVQLTSSSPSYPAGAFEARDGGPAPSARSVAATHLMCNNIHTVDGQKIAVGHCEGISIRRGATGNLVVDIPITTAEAAVVVDAFKVVALLRAKTPTTTGPAIPASTPAVGSTSSDHIKSKSLEELSRCIYGVDEAAPRVLAYSSLCGVAFSQGVNEMQTLANLSGTEVVHRQIGINLDSLSRFCSYYKKYKGVLLQQMKLAEKRRHPQRRSTSGERASAAALAVRVAATPAAAPPASTSFLGKGKSSQLIYPLPEGMVNPNSGSLPAPHSAQVQGEAKAELLVSSMDRSVDELIQCINSTEATASEKNVNVLVKASVAIRAVAGVVCILCKSGKDRTSMGVTLEQGRFLCEEAAVVDPTACIQTMRKYGVRRMNVHANTGQSMFAFNSIQRMALPSCYRPPLGTFTGKVNS